MKPDTVQKTLLLFLQKVSGESYRAYVPPKLPPAGPSVDLEKLYARLDKAVSVLGELNSIAESVPNTSLFIYMYVRKEALLSSQIEGTQSSFSDLILFEHHQKPNIAPQDVEEVSNYVKAIHYGLNRLQEGFPLSLRLLREVHKVLMSGTRGSHPLPGEFRKSQNWIGGSRPGNAKFVPPPPEQMLECLSDFEKFLHDDTGPILIKAGLAHVQIESIHPFLDGNGRLGRLLITLLLCENGILKAPILYLSLFLKQHRALYYELLQEVRTDGNWERWLDFFLEGVLVSAKQAILTANKINALFKRDLEKISTLGRARVSCERIFEYLKEMPQVTVPLVSKELGFSAPTARSGLEHLLEAQIVEEITGKKRDRVYVYRDYLNALESEITQ